MPTIQARKFEFVVDECDYQRLNAYRWWSVDMGGYVYAFTKIDGKRVGMHRLIVRAPEGKVVDHINGDTLDNQRSNLRVCLQSENMRNRKQSSHSSQPYKGVEACKGRWRARITVDGKRRHLGLFDLPEDAHKAYAAASKALHGEFGRAS